MLYQLAHFNGHTKFDHNRELTSSDSDQLQHSYLLVK